MTRFDVRSPFVRRSFLVRVAGAAAAFAAAFSGRAGAQTPAATAFDPPPQPWRPARHAKDDWLDQLPGQHRFFFDVTKTSGLVDAILFAGNFFDVNKNEYGVSASDLAVVVGLRHDAAPFAFTDAIWKKYGGTLARRAQYVDPKNANAVPAANPYTPVAPADSARVRGLAGLIRDGAQFAVCNVSTQGIAGMIARAVDGNRDDIYKELAANLIDRARLVPAGIVAVNRAQERGYSITSL